MNDAQKLHFRASCQYIDKLLSGIEDILHASESKSPFPKYKVDINLAQIRVLEDFIKRFRTLLVRTLAWQNIAPPQAEIPATRAIGVNLNFIDITLADMRPSAMRGAGALLDSVAAQLSGVVHELSSLTESMTNYVQRELDESLRERIASLSTNDASDLIRTIEEVVTRHGLVDFRPRIDILLSRLEDQTFEIAVFGRVSSGKSSFLNAVLHTEVLPVGVNPITAVPTRISFGDKFQALVRYGTGTPAEVTLEEFRSLISERSNPGNEKAVSRASLKVSSPRLAEGVVLVDTPGLGSLARRGAAETLAYLPSCDLALLLIDAGSTLTDEDIATLRVIKEAAIPSMVLLSKCDLLNAEDVQATTEYMHRQLSDYLGQDIPTFPVSSIASQHDALETFFERVLHPKIQQAETLKEQSIQRKLERLRSDVVTSLETRLDHQENRAPAVSQSRVGDLEANLRAISGAVGDLRSELEHRAMLLRSRTTGILTHLAQKLTETSHPDSSISSLELSEKLHDSVATEVEPIIALAQRVASQSIEDTRKIGAELGRSDLPDHRELDDLFREAPRFEMAELPADISVGGWKILGEGIARSRLRRTLIEKIKPILDTAISDYARTLEQWSRSLARILQQSVNSYLDAYRSILQSGASSKSEDEDPGQLRDDIRRLREHTSHQPAEGD